MQQERQLANTVTWVERLERLLGASYDGVWEWDSSDEVDPVLLRGIIDTSPDYIYVKDRSLRTVFCNEVFARVRGKRPREMIGKTDIENGLAPEYVKGSPERGTRGYEKDDLAALAGQTVYVPLEAGNIGDELRYFETFKLPLRTPLGEITGVLGVSRDITDRVRAEEALLESEKRYRRLFNALQEGLLIGEVLLDEAGQPYDFLFLEMNPAFERLTGIPREAVRGRLAREMVPELETAWLTRFAEVTSSGQPARFEQFSRRSGNWYEVYAYNHEPGRFVCLFIDITERKRAEDALRKSHVRLESLLEISQRPFRNVHELLDHTLEEAVRLTGSRIGYICSYHEERQELVLNNCSPEVMSQCTVANPRTVYKLEETGIWGEAVRQRKPILVNDYEADNSWKRGLPSGHVPLQRFLTVPVLNGERVVAVVGVANKPDPYDQTDVLELSLLMQSLWRTVERHRAEEALRESEERLSRAQKCAHLGTSETDLTTGRTVWSEEMYSICGCSPQTFQPTSAWMEELVLPEDREMAADSQRQALEENRTALLELRLCRPGGEIRNVQSWVGVVRDDIGRPVRLVVSLLDITERKRLEEQFLQAQKMESIGRLAGGVAHDFNNLLTVIKGNAEMALGSLKEDDALRGDLGEIIRAAERAAELTGRLLTFSRRQIVDPKVLDLNALLSSQERMFRRLIGEHIRLTLRLAAGLKTVKIDPGQLDQVLTNLLVNARDAMPAGGRLLIETANVRFDEGSRRQHAETLQGEFVMLAVSDTGIGMSEETQNHLFEPFFTTKPPGTGTGLGLSTCYGIVKQNRGAIEFHSECGKGTTVKVYLPATELAAQPIASELTPFGDIPGGGETVLLVEDDPAIRQLSRRALASCGYRVYAAENGQAALQIAENLSASPDLLVTDVVLPGWNGREIAERLKTHHPALRVLYVSGYTANAIVHHGVLEAGIIFLQKPFSPSELARKVREVLDGPPG